MNICLPRKLFSVLCVVEFGKVSRNCTEDGWSEMFPHYVDVCPFDDNQTRQTSPMVSIITYTGDGYVYCSLMTIV